MRVFAFRITQFWEKANDLLLYINMEVIVFNYTGGQISHTAVVQKYTRLRPIIKFFYCM
jgi:hypothetical protein